MLLLSVISFTLSPLFPYATVVPQGDEDGRAEAAKTVES